MVFLILSGVTVAAIGVYIVDSEPDQYGQTMEQVHDSEMTAEEGKTTVSGEIVQTLQEDATSDTPDVPKPDKGLTVGELMRWSGMISIVVALAILLYIEFFYKANISRATYRTLMVVSMFALPVVVVLGTGSTVLETTKTVESCASCHVMDPFVNDLFDEESTTLAARHKKNGWISEYQCYTCHTTYGAHGTFEGKRDGFRHWLLFVTQTWDEPISYSGSYPNQNCTTCHGGTETFREVDSHRALSEKLQADEVSCSSCHGPAHPTPGEREDVPESSQFSEVYKEISSDEFAKLKEMFNEERD